MSENAYVRYHEMQKAVDQQLERAAALCEGLEMRESVQQLTEARENLARHRFSVGILGEFRRGKSTVINSLLGEHVLPADIVPCTATMNRVTWGAEKAAELLMMDGTVRKIPYEELKEYVTKITLESEERAAEVDSAIIYYPCPFCENGADIIDTPGLNDDERMTVITEEVIPTLDAIIMVLVNDSPFSESEADFVRRKLMTSDVGRMIFVVNKIDQVSDPDERAKLLDTIRERIRAKVIQRTAQVYGKDAPEVEEAKRKLSSIVVYPYSARDALKGRLLQGQGSAESGRALVQGSGYPELEKALTRLLVEERGTLELAKPFNLAVRAVGAAKSGIMTRVAALDMDLQSFEAQKRESAAVIKRQREAKELEKERLSKAKQRMMLELEADTRAFYGQLEEKLGAAVDRGITERNASQSAKELTARLAEMAKGTIEDEVSCFGERCISRISTLIGAELQHTEVVMGDLVKAMEEIRSDIAKASPSSGVVEGALADIATDMMGIYGLGGFISGWRTAGWKGALVGGASGGAAMVAATIVLGTLGLANLPVIIASCIVGSVVGRLVPGALFKAEKEKREAEQVRKKIKAEIANNIAEMRKEGQLEKWVKDTLEGQMNAAIEGMERECEQAISETERMLRDIETQLRESADSRDAMKARYQQMLEACAAVLSGLKPVKDYVDAIPVSD